jgi:SAM-dependent methyltransferase
MDLTVCDLGCGDGSLLMEAERMGYRTSGCEQDNFSVKIANSRLIGGVESTTVSNYLQHIKSLPSLVVMSHSLEHLLDPGETLRRIYSLMPSGGILVLALPNADQGRKSRIKTYWGYWQVPVHVTHFGAKEFPKYLSRLGFRVESMRLRSFDFLTLGSTVLNFLKINSGDLGANTSLVSRIVLPFAGFVWRSGLKFGSSEMVIEVRKR